MNPDQGFSVEGDIANTNIGLFIQDAWAVNDRLTLNLGLRTENESVPSYTTADGTAPIAIEWGFGEKLAPRLGFAYDLAGDGKTKLYGNWGIYYDIFKLELPQGSFGGQKWLEYYYTLDTPNCESLDPAGCPPACPGRLLDGPIDFRHPSNAPGEETLDSDIKPMKLQEFTFGFERELGKHLAMGARYIHKQIDRAIEDVGQLDDDRQRDLHDRQPGLRRRRRRAPGGRHPRDRLPEGGPRLRRDGADLRQAPVEPVERARQLHAEPPLRQLPGPVADRRERPHQPERRPLVRLPADGVRRHSASRCSADCRPIVRTSSRCRRTTRCRGAR